MRLRQNKLSKLNKLLCLIITIGSATVSIESVYAGGIAPCNNYNWAGASYDVYPGTIGYSSTWVFYLYKFTLVSSKDAFNVSDSRSVVNSTSADISATFTANYSKTFSVSVTATMEAQIVKWLTASISSTIQKSYTTDIGVSATTNVPPFTTRHGEYGVKAYDLTLDVQLIKRIRWSCSYSSSFCSPDTCIDEGITRQTLNAPTNEEQWRID